MTQARFFVVSLLALALIAFSMQLFIDFSSENISVASIVLASSLTVLLYILWTDAIQTHPLSTFAVFGFCITTQLGALLAQSATWIPLVNNLRQPVETFATLGLYQVVAVSAHGLYRQFSKPATYTTQRDGLVRTSFGKLGLYDTPSASTLWLMGIVGLSSYAFSGGAGIVSKVAQGLTFSAWAPFLIPIYVLQHGASYCKAQKNYIFLVLYAGVIALLAISANARGMMLIGLMTIALFAILQTMRSASNVKAAQLAKVGLVLAVLTALAIPMDYMVTAMGVARNVRTNASSTKMLEETWYYLQQPRLLQAEKERNSFIGLNSRYDETYFSSSLVGRLVETKFHDNALYFGSRLNVRDIEELEEVTGNFLWAALPDPLLKALRVDVDKAGMNFSMGDYISHLAGAGPLGGYKTGSVFAQGIVIFGYAFPAIYFFLCLVLFVCIDLLAFRTVQGNMVVSALGMLGIWRMFQYGISAESLHFLFIAIVRGVPQGIALYLVVYHLSRIGANSLSNAVGGKVHRMQFAK